MPQSKTPLSQRKRQASTCFSWAQVVAMVALFRELDVGAKAALRNNPDVVTTRRKFLGMHKRMSEARHG